METWGDKSIQISAVALDKSKADYKVIILFKLFILYLIHFSPCFLLIIFYYLILGGFGIRAVVRNCFILGREGGQTQNTRGFPTGEAGNKAIDIFFQSADKVIIFPC